MDAGAEIDVVWPVEADSAAEISPEQDHEGRSEPSSLNQGEILKTLATVEKDSQAIAESFSSLFVSLRSTLSEVRRRFCESIFVSSVTLPRKFDIWGKLKSRVQNPSIL